MNTPDIRYTTTPDGIRLAYTITGSGPLLVFSRGWVSHLENTWSDPLLSRFFSSLSQSFTVVYYDARANGLSSREPSDLSEASLLVDLSSIINALGTDQVILYGQAFGGIATIRYASENPGRVSHLILDNTSPGGPELTDPERIGAIRSMLQMLKVEPDGFFAAMAYLSGSSEDVERRKIIERTRRSIYPLDAMELYDMAFDVDLTGQLGLIQCPTLVMHMDRNRSFPYPAAKYLADHIAGAQLVDLHGVSANIWEENTVRGLRAVGEFLGVPSLGDDIRPIGDPVPTAIMFTDAVGSTDLTRRIGDVAARQLFREHDDLIRRTVEDYAGRVVKHTGDGFLATFDLSESAVRAALEIQSFAGRLGDLGIRIGIHSGPVVHDDNDIFGIGVAMTSRVMSEAEAGQILTTDTVRLFTTSEDLSFRSTGSIHAKGFDDPIPVWVVE